MTVMVLAMVLFVGVHVALTKVAEARERQKVKAQQAAQAERTQDLVTLGSQINGVISANAGVDFSVSIIDPGDGKLAQYGDSSTFDSASVGKLITATDFLHQVETGQESLSETLGGNSAEYELQQMIVVSDDDAWATLNNELGYNQLQAYASQIGLNGYNAVNDTIGSSDIALLLEKLYKGQLLNDADTQLLLGYMKQANYRDFMVPAVPSGDTIYHKVGLINDDVHDAAIIIHGSQSLIVVIFTNGNGVYNWPARALAMQQITKDALAAYWPSS